MSNLRRPPPADMLAAFGQPESLRQYGPGEWGSECIQCGRIGHADSDPPDRMRWFEKTKAGPSAVWCRKCGFFQFTKRKEDLTESELRAAERLARQLAVTARREWKSRERNLRDRAEWERYNELMSANNKRSYWKESGVPDSFQDWWLLGWTPDKKIKVGDDLVERPAYTIPYRRVGGEVYNIQFRIMEPPNPNDKYRFTYGLETGLWLADIDGLPQGPCLLCEGAKKAMVAYIEIVGRANERFAVVSTPSKYQMSDSMLAVISECDPIYVALDPDAALDGTDRRMAAIINRGTGPGRARIVTLPAKLDDLVVRHEASGRDLARIIRSGRRL